MINKIRNSFAFRFPVLFYKTILNFLPVPKLTVKPTANFNYVVLCGARHYQFLKQTLLSARKNFEKLPTIYVFTDFGTSTRTIKKIADLYPADKLHIILAEDCLIYHKNSSPFLAEFARKNPMGLKLAAILQIADLDAPLLYADTDVLWLENPVHFLEGLMQMELDMHMSYDYQPGYDFNLIEKAGLLSLLKTPYYCAGIMFINRISSTNRAIIDNLLPIAAAKPDHLSEQTIFAHLQKKIGISDMSSDKFFLDYSDQFDIIAHFNPNWLARHYIGPVRHLFWRDAVAKKLYRP